MKWMSGGAKRQCDRALIAPIREVATEQLEAEEPEHRHLHRGRGGVLMAKWGLVTFFNSKRWTKEAAEGAQFTVGNGY